MMRARENKRTVLHNLVTPGRGNERRPVQILIEGETIAGLAGPDDSVTADERVDLGGCLVLPGAIDGHVHFDDPGFTQREDFATGTRAAAAGGVTMVVDMPCTSLPPVTSVDALQNKLAMIEPKAMVDFMLWGGVSGNVIDDPGWRDRLAGLVEAGIAAVKIYFLSGMETFTDLTEDRAHQVMETAAALAIPVGVHAEDRGVVERAMAVVQEEGGASPRDYARSRPVEGEVQAAETLRRLCRETGARTHIVHIASRKALDVVVKARAEGLPMSAETCPHYLLFTEDDLERLGSVLKTAPVVKKETDRQGLWRGLRDGDLLFVASDHAAGLWPDEKQTGSIWTDYGGVPGVELLLPTLYCEGVRKGRITLERLVEIAATEPAAFFGLTHRKGRMVAGCDADLAVVDEGQTLTVRADALHNKNRYTPLEGRVLSGRIVETWVRGRRVYERGGDGVEAFLPLPAGRFIRRGEGR